jgi:hypothetical protein
MITEPAGLFGFSDLLDLEAGYHIAYGSRLQAQGITHVTGLRHGAHQPVSAF